MLTDAIRDKIVQFVKPEPRTVQEVSKHIQKSWVTTEAYIQQISERTGMIRIKTFRKGTQGALKLVYYNYAEAAGTDIIKETLFHQIKTARFKQDFDFLEIFQYVPDKQKQSYIETADAEATEHLISLLNRAKSSILVFSGNLSFIRMKGKKQTVIEVLRDALERGVRIKILCRIQLSSEKNLKALQPLIEQYPGLLELRHCHQPLRGRIIDDDVAFFKDDETAGATKPEDADERGYILYEVYDKEWIEWLTKVFWNLYRTAIDHTSRWREIQKLR